MIRKWFEIQDGDIPFKNTEMHDRKKKLFMRIMNELTTGIQNFWLWIRRKELIEGQDHAEITFWNDGTLETTSSVHPQGVRTMNFCNWCYNEDFPKLVILRRPDAMHSEEKRKAFKVIAEDRGIPYNKHGAVRSVFPKRAQIEEPAFSGELMERGLFCIESVLRIAGFKDWANKGPNESFEMLIEKGYYVVFDGDSADLFEN